MNNLEKLEKIKELSKPLIEFIEQELSPYEKIEISQEGFKLISEEACLSKSKTSLLGKVNKILDKVYKLEDLENRFDFDIVSKELTRDEMIQVIENDLTRCEGFYLCPVKYGLDSHCETNCRECWLNAIKEVKFKGEE